MSDLTADDVLHASKDDAIEALRRVGADYEHRFDMEVESAELGKLHRVFGILGNVLEKKGRVEDDIIVNRLLVLVEDDDNERILEKMKSGKMSYTPVNKRALRRVAKEIVPAGVHLPWSWRAMNFDFAALASKVHRQSPLPFMVFYSQQIKIRDGVIQTSRIFSLPVEGHAQGTWAEPISDEMLDPDVGLIIEANYR